MGSWEDEVDAYVEADFGKLDYGAEWGLRRRKAGGHTIRNKYRRKKLSKARLYELMEEDYQDEKDMS